MDLKREIDPENPDVLVVQKIIEDRINLKDVEAEIVSIDDRIKTLEEEGRDGVNEYVYNREGALSRIADLNEAQGKLEALRDEIIQKRGG